MPLALEQGVGTIVWSPLAGGLLSGKVSRTRAAPEGSRVAALGPFGPVPPPERLHAIVDVLEAVAGETGRSVSQVAIRWVLQRPSVATVIMGARNEAQLRDNLGAAEFVLSPEAIARLDAVSASPPVYPYWHQLATFAERNPPAVPLAVPQRPR
jgi:aryl-alcohol dehydrogenase-like predicted oxidoreductase